MYGKLIVPSGKKGWEMNTLRLDPFKTRQKYSDKMFYYIGPHEKNANLVSMIKPNFLARTMLVILMYSKTCLKQPLKNIQDKNFNDTW